MSAAVGVTLYDVPVALAMAVYVAPSGDDCHCTVGVGVPVAAAVNVTVVFGHAVVLDGDVVTTGAALTVSTAALVVVDKQEFANTARYCLLLSVAVGVNVYAAVVGPAMSANVTPSVELCHFTLV